MWAFVARGVVLASLVFRGRWVRWVIRVVVLAVSIAAPSAAAASVWTVKRVHAPRQAELLSVSCSSASACTAVGYQGGGRSVLVERWNGRRWSIQATPGIPGMGLGGVSCPAVRVCVAVGSEGFSGLVERWNGAKWSVQSTPEGGGTFAVPHALSAVSCSSPTACTAVGTLGSGPDSDPTLVERWNGQAWSVQQSSASGALTGVSCPALTMCMAVGENCEGAAGCDPIGERWNGRDWIRRDPPDDAGDKVSCGSTRSCIAIGTSVEIGIARWDGLSWRAIVDNDMFLSGVSCTSARHCIAVGARGNGLSVPLSGGLIEHWNGTSWSSEPFPGARGTRWNDVSCPSPRACVAVGTDKRGPVSALS